MSRMTDQAYLLENQYHDGVNLNARAQLHALFSINKQGWQPWVFDHLDFGPESRILELGCGPCHLWVKNLERVPEGWDVTLSDFSPGMVEEARRNLDGSQRRFKFELIDAQAIPFEDESFDGVIANHMLYHVPDRRQAFSEIRRVLRPNGRFYATTVGRTHLQEMDELIKRFAPEYDPWEKREHPAGPFFLENGHDQLAEWFSKVALHRYEDDLIVTEAEPLVAYVLSMTTLSASVADRPNAFAKLVERELASHGGAIRITKDSGLFEAFREDRA